MSTCSWTQVLISTGVCEHVRLNNQFRASFLLLDLTQIPFYGYINDNPYKRVMLQVFKSEAHAFRVTSKCFQNVFENPVARQMSDVRCRKISGAL
jgi:hypothetical protein